MYEAHVAGGNNFEVACAFKIKSNIMGQTTSNHHGGSSSSSNSNRASKRNSKYNKSFSLRHSRHNNEEHATKLLTRDQLIRDTYDKLLNVRNQKGGTLPCNMNQDSDCSVIATTTISDQLSPVQQASRPITISEMNTYNIEKTNETINNQTNNGSTQPISANNNIINNNNSSNGNKNSLNDSCSSSTTTTNSQSHNSQLPNTKSSSNYTNNSKKDFYMVAEGYHKTDSCYYKTPDGGYHKLPPDSYHKMSEICYNKLPDGSFKRLVDIQNSNNSGNGFNGLGNDATNINYSNQSKVRNQMIRFLKRSKSHTPATAKELQKTKLIGKDSERRQREQRELIKNSNGAAQNVAVLNSGNNNKTGTYYSNNYSNNSNKNTSNSGNRKVVVTMMENGGLPIVATSKSKSPKSDYRHSHHSTSNREKVTKNA